jgi:membrane protease subunit (stomatin/prohibitin family)
MAEKRVVFQGSPEDVIWKSPVTELTNDARIYSRKDCDILFMRQGSLLAAFSDDKEYNVVNEETNVFQKMFNRTGIKNCAVYYINKNKHIQVKWGTPHRIDVHDKGFDMYTTVGAHGTYSFTIVNALKLFSKMKIFEESLTKDMINSFFHEEISMYLRKSITKAFSENEKGLRDIAEITANEVKISENIKQILTPVFHSYGVRLEKFIISKIDYDREFLNKIKDIRQSAVMNEYKKENKLVQEKQEPKKEMCDACGHKNPTGSKFCQNCGSKIVTNIECTSCNKTLPLNAKFCHHCGTKVGEE